MVVASLPAVPASFEAGNAVNLSLNYGNFHAASWSLQLVFSRAGCEAPVIFTGTTNGTGFDVALTSAVTADMQPGAWTWVAYVTSGLERTTAAAGSVTVLANLAEVRPKTVNELLLETINAAIATLAGSTNAIASFNGQTFTKANLKTLMDQQTQIAAAVIAEQRAERMARGENLSGRIPIQFVTNP
jgi:hypothetical protein